MAPKFLHKYTDGDLRPDLVGTLPYDLTGHTIELLIKRPDGSLLTKTAEITEAFDEETNLGTFVFEWEAGDLQVGANQICQVRDLDADSRAASWPKFLLDVIEQEQDE